MEQNTNSRNCKVFTTTCKTEWPMHMTVQYSPAFLAVTCGQMNLENEICLCVNHGP